MILEDLIKFFRNGKEFTAFCNEQSLDVDSEVIEVYMQKPFALEKEIFFFPIEETEGMVEYSHNGKVYYNLFDFYYFQDFIQDSMSTSHSTQELAKVLLKYAESDS